MSKWEISDIPVLYSCATLVPIMEMTTTQIILGNADLIVKKQYEFGRLLALLGRKYM